MIQLRGKVYYSDFLIGEDRIRRSLKTTDKGEALKRSAKLKAEMEAAAASGAGGVTIGEVIDFTWNNQWKHMRDKKKHGQCRLVLDLVGRNTPLAAVNKLFMLEIVNELRERKLSQSTMNRYLDCLTGAIRYYYSMNEIDASVKKLERLDEPKARNKWLTREEAAAMIAAEPNFRMRVYWKSQLWLGARCGEGSRMEWKHFDWERGMYFVGNDKNGNPQHVPVSADLLADFKVLKAEGYKTPFFANENMIRVSFRRMKRIAKITDDRVTPHTFRRTCATWLLADGMDIRHVQIWLGHKDVRTTEKYALVMPETLMAYRDKHDARAAVQQPAEV